MQISGEDTMRKLSKQKQQQLFLVAVVTVSVLAGLWLLLIKSQQESLRRLADRKGAVKQKLEQIKHAVVTADETEQQLCEVQKLLAKDEEGMASGDLYSWTITTLRTFKVGYKVEIPQFSQIDGPKEVNLLAGFPYKQASLMVAGTASFHEFGKFIADFENQFPFIRVMNLTLEPASASASNEKEKLSFKMEIAALVKPGAS
jgi:Tfp pilus assembly protein PilO